MTKGSAIEQLIWCEKRIQELEEELDTKTKHYEDRIKALTGYYHKCMNVIGNTRKILSGMGCTGGNSSTYKIMAERYLADNIQYCSPQVPVEMCNVTWYPEYLILPET